MEEGGGKSQFCSPAATVGGIVLIICVFSARDSTRLSKLDFYGNFKCFNLGVLSFPPTIKSTQRTQNYNAVEVPARFGATAVNNSIFIYRQNRFHLKANLITSLSTPQRVQTTLPLSEGAHVAEPHGRLIKTRMTVIHGRNRRNLLPASETAARRIIHTRKVPDNCSVITRATEMKRTGAGKETVQKSCSCIHRDPKRALRFPLLRSSSGRLTCSNKVDSVGASWFKGW